MTGHDDNDDLNDNDLGDECLWEEAWEMADAAGMARGIVVDRFLLAIIDKHPVEGADRNKRLSDAKQALLGSPKSKGRPDDDDHALLMEMADAYVSERCELELRCLEEEMSASVETTSIRRLAHLAALERPGYSKEATADRIRKKFVKNKRIYINMAKHSIRRLETWDLSEIDDVLKDLRLTGSLYSEDAFEF